MGVGCGVCDGGSGGVDLVAMVECCICTTIIFGDYLFVATNNRADRWRRRNIAHDAELGIGAVG